MSIAVSIIEDDAPAREILANWIRRAEGFRFVSEHGTAESALEASPALKPEVVLMDINLPGINGIECVRRLKPQLPATQFVNLDVLAKGRVGTKFGGENKVGLTIEELMKLQAKL